MFGWTDNNGDEYEPELIAEGVVICGRCVGNKHCDDSISGKLTREYILDAIVNG